jgi:hypothetical protein
MNSNKAATSFWEFFAENQATFRDTGSRTPVDVRRLKALLREVHPGLDLRIEDCIPSSALVILVEGPGEAADLIPGLIRRGPDLPGWDFLMEVAGRVSQVSRRRRPERAPVPPDQVIIWSILSSIGVRCVELEEGGIEVQLTGVHTKAGMIEKLREIVFELPDDHPLKGRVAQVQYVLASNPFARYDFTLWDLTEGRMPATWAPRLPLN